jgi:hypothetical protein
LLAGSSAVSSDVEFAEKPWRFADRIETKIELGRDIPVTGSALLVEA